MKLGKPKYEQNNKNYFAFKKDQNTFILRVLPPMGELADAGKWSVYHRVEFGYKTSDGKLKPFLSPRVVNFKGMVEVESESHKRREGLKAQAEQAKQSGDSATEERCKTLLRQYNQDAKHYMNVVDLQGNVGLFKIGHRGYQALKAEIDRLRSEGVDPIGVENGRYFVFSRSGKGRDTIYTVTEYKQKQQMTGPDGQTIVVDAPFPHSLNDAILNKLETDAFELNKVYPSVTAEEEYRIVHEGPTAVDAILGGTKKDTTNPAANPAAQPTGGVEAQQPAQQAAPAETTTVTTENVDTTVNTNTGEVVSEQPAQPAAQTTQEQPAASGGDLSQMSDEDFFKAVESGNI
jgi:hypothetical protein